MSKIVLFQAIQFVISTQFSSIWPIGRTLSGTTTPGWVGRGAMSIKRYPAFNKSEFLKPHPQIVYCHVQDICLGSLTPLQRWIRCILQLQPTGLGPLIYRSIYLSIKIHILYWQNYLTVPLVGAVEYADCISTERVSRIWH